MQAMRIRRVFNDFVNGKTQDTVTATTFSDKSITIHAMMGGQGFPKKLNINPEEVQNVAVLNEEDVIHWVVVEGSYFKADGMDSGITILWIRFIGTAAECCKYIEKNEKISSLERKTSTSILGGKAKVFDTVRTPTTFKPINPDEDHEEIDEIPQ